MREHGVLRRALLVYSEASPRQHDRGRRITDYISAIARKGSIAPADATPFANILAELVRMYEQFEDLEHRMFGKDGFEDAVTRIAAIEQAFGPGDLAALTAPVPPKAG